MKFYIQNQINMQAKNNAWRELQKYAQMYDGTLLTDCETPARFIANIKQKVSWVNEKWSRCTNLTMNQEIHDGRYVVYVGVGADLCFTMLFLPIKKEMI